MPVSQYGLELEVDARVRATLHVYPPCSRTDFRIRTVAEPRHAQQKQAKPLD